MLANFHGPEWIVILVVALLIFGGKKLPELGSSVGKSIQNFKRGMAEGRMESEDKDPSPASKPADQQ